ncbi:Chaperone surA [Gossypium australe]|uniref:Chaperone surA n=1 Tax=Gossypium australe TaxID=47621 RepID=A0A5B6VMD6_9ROSI|nr:Chaperone surA [Gossypium australe]
MSSNRARAEFEEAESNAQASVQRAASSSSTRPISEGRGEKAKEAFFQMMNEWFTEYLRTKPVVQQPPSPVPQPIPDMPPGDFKATAEDDPERAELWLENTIMVLDELSCTLEECLKYVVSLLKDSTY